MEEKRQPVVEYCDPPGQWLGEDAREKKVPSMLKAGKQTISSSARQQKLSMDDGGLFVFNRLSGQTATLQRLGFALFCAEDWPVSRYDWVGQLYYVDLKRQRLIVRVCQRAYEMHYSCNSNHLWATNNFVSVSVTALLRFVLVVYDYEAEATKYDDTKEWQGDVKFLLLTMGKPFVMPVHPSWVLQECSACVLESGTTGYELAQMEQCHECLQRVCPEHENRCLVDGLCRWCFQVYHKEMVIVPERSALWVAMRMANPHADLPRRWPICDEELLHTNNLMVNQAAFFKGGDVQRRAWRAVTYDFVVDMTDEEKFKEEKAEEEEPEEIMISDSPADTDDQSLSKRLKASESLDDSQIEERMSSIESTVGELTSCMSQISDLKTCVLQLQGVIHNQLQQAKSQPQQQQQQQKQLQLPKININPKNKVKLMVEFLASKAVARSANIFVPWRVLFAAWKIYAERQQYGNVGSITGESFRSILTQNLGYTEKEKPVNSYWWPTWVKVPTDANAMVPMVYGVDDAQWPGSTLLHYVLRSSADGHIKQVVKREQISDLPRRIHYFIESNQAYRREVQSKLDNFKLIIAYE